MRVSSLSLKVGCQVAMALAALSLVACSEAPAPAAAVPVAAPAAATSVAPSPAVQVALKDHCTSAFAQLRQCQAKLASSGQASAVQVERSATYLRRLQAWWEMERANPVIQSSCQAIAAGGLECEPEDPADEAESAAEFRTLMEQFDKAGVPK